MKFKNRFDAGHRLALKLDYYTAKPDTFIIAIPRGGLEIGYVLSRDLKLPLDIIFTKKIGYPVNPEYAIGAVSLTHAFINPDYANNETFKNYIAQEIETIRSLLQERSQLYRGNKPPLECKNKTIIVTDDGVATGSTLMATLELIKQENPKKIIVALPVCPPDTLDLLKHYTHEVICLIVPTLFSGVGQFYESFDQVDDQEAIKLLRKAYP